MVQKYRFSCASWKHSLSNVTQSLNIAQGGAMNPLHRPSPRRPGGWLLATAIIAAVSWIAVPFTDTTPADRLPVARFTGEIAPAGPVYRLPPVQVVARRSVELARIERDADPCVAQDRPPGAGPATRPRQEIS
jgi:hypothetical protein